jgi:hypothetical protein
VAAEDDKVQIGLTRGGDDALDQIMALGLFASEGDAYRFAVAYALGRGITPAEGSGGGFGTKFHASGGLDRDGNLRQLVTLLKPEHSTRPYATAERLADAGLRELAQRLLAHETLTDMLSELSSA